MAQFAYVGSGPYCFTNSLAMMTGDHSPAVIEFATGSPFGMQTFGNLAFFDPYGWDPLQGLPLALEAMGWESTEIIGANEEEAIKNLKEALIKGPVFVGPLEMGLLSYNPISTGPIGADHYVVVTRHSNGILELHDPHGHPYATIPLDEFMKAWKADTLGYGKSYTMRTDFKRVQHYSEEEVIKRSLANNLAWLSGSKGGDMPPDGRANGEAVQVLSSKLEEDLPPSLRGDMIFFMVRVGARRAADGATCLSRIGYDEAASIMTEQARLIGSLQYPAVKKDAAEIRRILAKLAPTYDALKTALEAKLGPKK